MLGERRGTNQRRIKINLGGVKADHIQNEKLVNTWDACSFKFYTCGTQIREEGKEGGRLQRQRIPYIPFSYFGSVGGAAKTA